MKSCKGCVHENLESEDCMYCSRAYTDEYERKVTPTNAKHIRIMMDGELDADEALEKMLNSKKEPKILL